MNQNSSVRKLVHCGMVAAIYVVLCLALQPLSYGAVQVRVAEALCLLPVFGAEYIVGVVLGCFLANLLGSTIVDVIFGTLATLLACLVTYKLRNVRFKGLAIAASLPPVLFNAVIIGIEIAVMFPDPTSSAPIWLACITNGISVGIGEVISCTVLGVVYSAVIYIAMYFWGRDLCLMFLDTKDLQAVEIIGTMSRQFLLVNLAFYVPLLFVNLLRFTIQGLGFSELAVLAGVFEMIARGVFGICLVPLLGFTAVCYASPAAWIMADLFLFPAYVSCMKKRGFSFGKKSAQPEKTTV